MKLLDLEKFEVVKIEARDYNYLYNDGSFYTFMILKHMSNISY